MNLKITIIGDGMVGKTSIFQAFTQKTFSGEKYIPTIFDDFEYKMTIDNREYYLHLFDTAGQEDYERIRRLSYPQTNVFIICYAIDNRNSFENITSVWLKEIRESCGNTPIILVGSKKDLRTIDSNLYVSYHEGLKLCNNIKAYALVECSAKNDMENIDEIFRKAIEANFQSDFQKVETPTPEQCCSKAPCCAFCNIL